jgi:transposase InsO family protein
LIVADVTRSAADYSDLLAAFGIQPSMSRTGKRYDNANAESFIKTLRYEQVDGRIYRDAPMKPARP